MKKSFVLERNKERMVMNWINNYIWFKKPIKESFAKTIEYYRTMEYIEHDIREEEVRKYLIEYVRSFQDIRTLDKLLNRLKEQNIVKSFKTFMESEELIFKNKKEFHNFIINNLVIE